MKEKFYKWLDEIDHELQITTGITIEELGEYQWFRWYNENFNPLEAIDAFFDEWLIELTEL